MSFQRALFKPLLADFSRPTLAGCLSLDAWPEAPCRKHRPAWRERVGRDEKAHRLSLF